jgi:hypothetical protein
VFAGEKKIPMETNGENSNAENNGGWEERELLRG